MAVKKSKAGSSLDAIFRPRAVAVVGASRREQSIGNEILKNLIGFGYTGPVYPVNPSAPVVHSIRSYPSVLDCPDPLDLAVLVVPRDAILPVVRECAKKGVRGLVTITAGFREVDEEGADLEAELKSLLKKHDIRMIGPNCMGVINSDPKVRLNATFASQMPERGGVGFISQSGALGEAILADAAQTGLGVAMFASMGNKTDVTADDLLEYWEHDDDIGTILMYLESFGNPSRFIPVARRVTRRKPVITVKAGRTAAGARAASSHTGSIVGLDLASTSLLEQCGVLRVNSMEEMFVQAEALAHQPLPRGKRVAVITNAGGPGILCTDALIGRGAELAEFSPATKRAVRRVLPPEASSANPIDMIASADGAKYRTILKAVARDPNVDAMVAIFVSPIMIDAFEVAKAISEAADGTKPLLSVFMGKRRSAEGVQLLRSAGVPVYRFPEEAASGMIALQRYREMRDRPLGKEVRFRVRRAAGRRVIESVRAAGRRDLNSEEVRELLEAYRFPMVPSRDAYSAAETIVAAQELGYPVTIKACSEKILHKTDIGGVILDLRNADEVGEAHRKILKRTRKLDPDAGVTVQPHLSGGREIIFGVLRDPQFGPLLMIGLGGIFVEVLRDVALHLHPLTDEDARRLIRGLRGFPLLEGVRGEPGVDLEIVEETLLRLSQLVGDLGDTIAELDLNPMIARPKGKKSYVVDARIRLTEV
jgi:acetyltransferase